MSLSMDKQEKAFDRTTIKRGDLIRPVENPLV